MRIKPSNEIPLFGRKLRGLRQSRHMTQEELAQAIGMTRQMICYLESRDPNPTIEVVRKFADYFGVSADELIYDQIDEQRKPGPRSKFDLQVEQLRKLPQAKQKLIGEMIDALIKG